MTVKHDLSAEAAYWGSRVIHEAFYPHSNYSSKSFYTGMFETIIDTLQEMNLYDS